MRLFHVDSLILTLCGALVVACNGGGEPTTSVGATETSTGTGTGTTSPTTSTTSTDPTTTEGSNSGTGSTTAPDSTTSTDPTTGSGTTTEPGTTTDVGTTGTTDVGTTGTGTTTGVDTTGVDTTGGSTTGEPLMCPSEPNDTECQACTKDNCCDEVIACGMDMKCSCFFGCLAGGKSLMQCANMCMVGMPGQNPNIAGLFECNSANCMMECGL